MKHPPTPTKMPVEIPQAELRDFCRRHHIRWLALFGSVLRQDFGQDSDIDVLVEFDLQTLIGLMTYIDIMHELSDLLHHRVDLVLRDGLKLQIKDEILSMAQVIYEV